MSTKEEQRSAFLMKRTEFRTYIKKLAESQREDKDSFRYVKTQPWSTDRDSALNQMRRSIVAGKGIVRGAMLAYAMFRGKPYAKVEQKCKEKPSAYLVYRAFQRMDLGDCYDKTRIEAWLSGGLPRIDLPELPKLELPGMPVPETVGGL